MPLLTGRVQIRPRMWSVAGVNAFSRVLRGGSYSRGSGQTDSMAAFTVRKPTQYLRCTAQFDMPARTSRHFAVYGSALDVGGTAAVPRSMWLHKT
ncbi:hypothetical protein FM21_27435 [Streptomyces mutabilis]|uniref:Uncharacterized protein n=1 Tax=Streptomyces mutabilis TaxID=67332 RepID=A0A086N011_9ACTN|nr:hypothetical protein FM21_27435 [Streptomyces mutabilis]